MDTSSSPPPPCAQHVLSRAQSIAMSDLCNVLLAFARLNFRPEQEDSFFNLVRSPCRWEGGSLAGAGGRATSWRDFLGLLGATLEPQHFTVGQSSCRPRRRSWGAHFLSPP